MSNVNGAITIRRANDGRAESPVENLLRETKSRSRWDDDDWSGRSYRWNRDDADNLSKTLREGQSLVMDIVGTTLDTIDIDDIEFDHRREMLRGQREIQRDIQEGIREAQREIQRAMREAQREMRDWEREKDW